MKILITGGAGFIGSNLARALVSRDIDVRILDNFSNGTAANVETLPIEIIQGDVRDLQTFMHAGDGCDSIVHLAALGSIQRSIDDPESTNAVNVGGTLNACLVATRLGAQLIFASSSSIYGSNPVLPRGEDDLPMPISPYAVSKLAGEQYVSAFTKTMSMSGLSFRFFNVYGPHQSIESQYAAVLPKFILAGVEGANLEIFGDGEQSRDFTYVIDLVEVIIRAIENRTSLDWPLNLAFGREVKVSQLAKLVQQRFPDIGILHLNPKIGDVRRSNADTSLLFSYFSDLRITPIEIGVQQTIDWYVNEAAYRRVIPFSDPSK